MTLPEPADPAAWIRLDDAEADGRQVLAGSSVGRMALGYYASGARDQHTLRANRDAWSAHALHYRVLRGVGAPDLGTRLLGTDLSMPVIAAPTAFHQLAHPDGERATAQGTAAAGALMTLSTLSTTAVEDVCAARRAVDPDAQTWFQLYVYKDRGVTQALVARAQAAGCTALVFTVDAPVLGTREADVRGGFHLPPHMALANLAAAGERLVPAAAAQSGLAAYVDAMLDPALSWQTLEWLVSVSRVPVLVKGIVRADDAVEALRRGAAGVVVSNHGGRQLDTAPATADVLRRVASAARTERPAAPVLVDSGVRRGTDVVKALAMGADAVMLGRPILWGLAAAGAPGVTRVLQLLREELHEALILCGCRSLADVGADSAGPLRPRLALRCAPSGDPRRDTASERPAEADLVVLQLTGLVLVLATLALAAWAWWNAQDRSPPPPAPTDEADSLRRQRLVEAARSGTDAATLLAEDDARTEAPSRAPRPPAPTDAGPDSALDDALRPQQRVRLAEVSELIPGFSETELLALVRHWFADVQRARVLGDRTSVQDRLTPAALDEAFNAPPGATAPVTAVIASARLSATQATLGGVHIGVTLVALLDEAVQGMGAIDRRDAEVKETWTCSYTGVLPSTQAAVPPSDAWRITRVERAWRRPLPLPHARWDREDTDPTRRPLVDPNLDQARAAFSQLRPAHDHRAFREQLREAFHAVQAAIDHQAPDQAQGVLTPAGLDEVRAYVRRYSAFDLRRRRQDPSVRGIEVVAIRLDPGHVRMTVRVAANFVDIVEGADGLVRAGDPATVRMMHEYWTLELGLDAPEDAAEAAAEHATEDWRVAGIDSESAYLERHS